MKVSGYVLTEETKRFVFGPLGFALATSYVEGKPKKMFLTGLTIFSFDFIFIIQKSIKQGLPKARI